MKYSFGLFLAVLLLLTVRNASADTITIRDSVYADSIYLFPFGASQILDPNNAFGVPDSQYAHFGPLGLGPLLDLMFIHSDGVTALPIVANGTLRIWGKKDPAVDSSAAQVKFVKTDAEGVILYESQQYILGDGLNTIETDKDYTYLEFTLTGTEFNPGSQGYLLDAVLLVQNRDSTFAGVDDQARLNASRIVTSYPNPFISANQSTAVTVHLDRAAEAALRLYDGLGREVDAFSLGMTGAGDHTVIVHAPEPQVYFVRLFVEGHPTGSIYRLIAQ